MVRSVAKRRVSNHGNGRLLPSFETAARKSAVADLRIMMPISDKPEIGAASSG